MTEFYTLAELHAFKLPDVPASLSSLQRLAEQAGWRDLPGMAVKVQGKTKAQWKYSTKLLPQSAQVRLGMIESATTEEQWEAAQARKNALWQRFERLSNDHREICKTRLKVLDRVEELAAQRGVSRTAAIAIATLDAGVQKSAYYEWQKMTDGYDRGDWLAALAPSFAPSADGLVREIADCHPDAWNFLKSDYLRPEKPAFSACFRRMQEACKIMGWSPVPSERSLRRRIETEVGKAVLVLTRESRDKAKQLYPAQRRTRADMHAMQAVNMDGHKLDIFVRLPNDKITRVFLLGIQDLYSGKILSWRIAENETWDAARLAIGDMVEAYGIPESIDLDNGRAFASKQISGGAKTRYRNKINPDDPNGLLVTLGIKPRFVTPESGQSKPIERAWGDFAENVSKHPICSGAYTGKNPTAKPENYGKTAIKLADLRRLVASQVVEHNARPGRRTEVAKGRSFDEVFAESMAAPSTIVRVPSQSQKFLWLLTAESIKASKGNGMIHFQNNRYWNVALNQWMGKKITIRFDPDALHEAVKVYDLQNRFICEAACIDDAGHHSVDAARTHGRNRKDYQKATAAVAAAHKALTPMQLGEILDRGNRAIEKPEPIRPSVTRLITHSQLSAEPVDAISEQHFENSFSRALGLVQGSVLEFPSGNTPANSASGGQHEPKSSEYGSGKKKGGRKTAR